MQKLVFLVVLAAILVTAGLYLELRPGDAVVQQGGTGTLSSSPAVEPILPRDPLPEQPLLRVEPRTRYVLDVVLHTVDEIEEMLDKAEQLASKPRSSSEPASIAMVLHGPEIDIFSIQNYQKYQGIVDRAARLDAYNIIEVKMCMTTMRTRGLRSEDVPGFIELVPYGPDEVEKLQRQGYVKL